MLTNILKLFAATVAAGLIVYWGLAGVDFLAERSFRAACADGEDRLLQAGYPKEVDATRKTFFIDSRQIPIPSDHTDSRLCYIDPLNPSGIFKDAGRPVVVCGDFLSRLGICTEHLKFDGCNLEGEGEVAFVARYTGVGKDAMAVEKCLQEQTWMKPLEYACCGWETSPDRKGVVRLDEYRFDVSMHSDETVVRDREQWHAIDRFHVRIEAY